MRHAISLCCVVFLAACSARDEDAPPTAASAGLVEDSGVELADASAPLNTDKNIGDVEQEVGLSITLGTSSQSDAIKEKTLKNLKSFVTMNTIDVYGPPPAELWVHLTVMVTSNYSKQPIAIRGTMLRDNEPFDTFLTRIGDYSERQIVPEGVVVPNKEFDFNVLAGLPVIPDTMLVTARAEALLFPVGTADDSVDPATAQVEKDQITTILGTPVRINFHPDAAPATPAPVPEAAEAHEHTEDHAGHAHAPAPEATAMTEHAPAPEATAMPEPAPAPEAVATPEPAPAPEATAAPEPAAAPQPEAPAAEAAPAPAPAQ